MSIAAALLVAAGRCPRVHCDIESVELPRRRVDDAGNRTESNPVAIQVEGGHLHGRDDLAGLAVEDVDALVLADQDRAGRAVHRDVGRGRSGDLCDRAAGAVDCVDASLIGDVERASRRVNIDARKAIAERDRMRDRQRAAVERPYCASTRGGGEAGVDGTGDRVNGQMGRRRSLSPRLVAAITLSDAVLIVADAAGRVEPSRCSGPA